MLASQVPEDEEPMNTTVVDEVGSTQVITSRGRVDGELQQRPGHPVPGQGGCHIRACDTLFAGEAVVLVCFSFIKIL